LREGVQTVNVPSWLLDGELLLGLSLGRGRSIRACQPRCLLPLSGPLAPPVSVLVCEVLGLFLLLVPICP
jgi:hypothetical protein